MVLLVCVGFFVRGGGGGYMFTEVMKTLSMSWAPQVDMRIAEPRHEFIVPCSRLCFGLRGGGFSSYSTGMRGLVGEGGRVDTGVWVNGVWA